MKEKEKVFLIFNPASQTGEALFDWVWLQREVEQACSDWQWVMRTVGKEEKISDLVQKAIDQGMRKIILAGGDGTIASAIQNVVLKDSVPVTFGVLPLGRGNDFYRVLKSFQKNGRKIKKPFFSFKKHKKPSTKDQCLEAIEILKKGKIAWLDVGETILLDGYGKEIKKCFFINEWSFGFPAQVVFQMQKKEKHGIRRWIGKKDAGYFIEGMWNWFRAREISMRVEAHGKESQVWEEKFWGGFVLNAAFNGGGMRWCQQTNIQDGEFELLCLKNLSTLEMVRLFQRIRSGKGLSEKVLFREKKLFYQKVNSVTFTCLEDRHFREVLFEADGESYVSPQIRQARIRILPKKLPFFVAL